MPRSLLLSFLCVLLLPSLLLAQTREEKVRADRAKVEANGFWIYNDLEKGFTEATESGKPLMVVMRCIPCEECVKLDEDLLEQDPLLKPLLDQFVRVRIVSTNGLDLSLFQYDFDQSFGVFLFNADRTLYARFGTRSHRTDWAHDVSLEGLGKAMQATLSIHRNYPANRSNLAGKQGKPVEFASPEKYPTLREKYTDKLNYEGNVVQSCIHCHQVGDAQREVFRNRNQPIPTETLFQYPHPKILGLIFDPKEMATLLEVETSTTAAESGFQAGDRIVSLDGQWILSIADVQWVLHHAPEQGDLATVVRREGKNINLTLTLPEGWRTWDDLSWRATTWPMRRMATGGLLLIEADDEERSEAGVDSSQTMALRVKHVGQYGAHAAAKRAGFKTGDIVVSFAGRDDLVRETDLIAYAVQNHKPGEQVPVVVIRGGKRVSLNLPMQK